MSEYKAVPTTLSALIQILPSAYAKARALSRMAMGIKPLAHITDRIRQTMVSVTGNANVIPKRKAHTVDAKRSTVGVTVTSMM